MFRNVLGLIAALTLASNAVAAPAADSAAKAAGPARRE